MTRLFLTTTLAGMLVLSAGSAVAHTMLHGSTPASGSILPASPNEIVLTFMEPTRLASVTVETAGQPARRLKIGTKGVASIIVIPAPGLAHGRNALQWRAVSKDGHAVSGEIILVIRPPR